VRTRLLMGGIAAMIVLGGSALAIAGNGERRTPAPTAQSGPANAKLDAKTQLLKGLKAKKCQTVQCFNQQIKKLNKAVNNLERDAFVCEKFVNMTQYSGYVYTPDGGSSFFETTAIDYTEAGGAPTDRVVVYTC
jgi:hypothetical protein